MKEEIWTAALHGQNQTGILESFKDKSSSLICPCNEMQTG